ncbi:MAG: PQQ-binding-like beta-propeller repeat protein, partial [Phycisphaerae bacterium]
VLTRPLVAGLADSPMPPLVRPVVAEGRIIYRTDEAVEARDALTGTLMWRTNELPMIRNTEASRRYHRLPRQFSYTPSDRGRYALTVADDKVFALAAFAPPMPTGYGPWGVSDDEPVLSGSSLVALSARSGEVLWRVGHDDDADEFLRECTFISAPTAAEGCLYAMAVTHDRYHVVCLDARDGSLVWKAGVSQRPLVGDEGPGGMLNLYLLETGSPPAVEAGKVYASTNAGVIAALDARSGRGLWARRYRSRFDSMSFGFQFRPGRNTSLPGGNPVVVSDGRVVSLPADSRDVLAFSTEGEPLWTRGREGLLHLTQLDESRILLSGPGLLVLSLSDGRPLPDEAATYSTTIADVRGRPAVTGGVVYASGSGRMHRLDLSDYSVESVPVEADQCLLGNLVALGERIIAANSAGVAAYFSYEMAREELTRRLSEASSVKRPELLLQRARFALETGRAQDALDDLLACRRELEQEGEDRLGGQVRTLLRRSYIALGNQAEKPAEMVQRFEQALEISDDGVETAEMLLRIAKARLRAGEVSAAVDIAQRISDSCGDLEITDVSVGPEAVSSSAGDDRQRMYARVIAQGFIRRLIELHGRQVYAKHDAAAEAALEQARQAGDLEAILDVRREKPNSSCADEALLAAAELLYTRAQTESGRRAAELMGRVAGYLAELAGTSEGPLRASAGVALAAIRLRAGQEIPARLTLDSVRDMPADTPVAFGDIRGTLRELIDRIDSGDLPAETTEISEQPDIDPPLRHVFSIEGPDVHILRDDRFRPLRFGQSLLVVKGDRVMLLDVTATDAASAQRWSGLTLIDGDELRKNSYDPPSFRLLGVKSSDEDVVAVADRRSVTGIDVRSAKVLWGESASGLGLDEFFCMAGGDGAFVAVDTAGRFVIVNVADGEVRARGRLESDNPLPVAPPEVAGGNVLLRYDKGGAASVFDLETGRELVDRRPASGFVSALLAGFTRADEGDETPSKARQLEDARLLGDGRVLVLARGELELFDPSTPDEPVWTSAQEGKQKVILDADDRWAVLAEYGDRPRTYLIDLRDGSIAGSYCMQTLAGIPRFGHSRDAQLADGDLYLTFATEAVSQPPKSRFGLLSVSNGLTVCRYPLEAGDGDGPV